MHSFEFLQTPCWFQKWFSLQMNKKQFVKSEPLGQDVDLAKIAKKLKTKLSISEKKKWGTFDEVGNQVLRNCSQNRGALSACFFRSRIIRYWFEHSLSLPTEVFTWKSKKNAIERSILKLQFVSFVAEDLFTCQTANICAFHSFPLHIWLVLIVIYPGVHSIDVHIYFYVYWKSV